MNKLILLFAFALVFFNAGAQNRFFTKDAKINFNSSTSLEDIIAESNQATTFIDIEKNEVAFSVLTTSFKFRRALMEEHFNENYMESSKFPKAKFTGKIVSPIDWKSEKAVVVDVKGELTMHGATKEVTFKATITPGKSSINAIAELKVTPEDFKIAIPSAVRDKIAKEVTIKIDAVYAPYQQ
ncbi:MAG TPA: YceI family protein [Prolixibacteraceae bacterium]|nr:YceI family protein [Prolixibacteraceae bacterium]